MVKIIWKSWHLVSGRLQVLFLRDIWFANLQVPFSQNGDGAFRQIPTVHSVGRLPRQPLAGRLRHQGLFGTGLPPSLPLSGSHLTPGPWHEKQANSATTTKADSPSTSSYAPVAPAPIDPKLGRQRVSLKEHTKPRRLNIYCHGLKHSIISFCTRMLFCDYE